jgi:uncharacterized protein (DUF1330 family)
MSKGYVIADIEVTDQETYGRYRDMAGATVAAHGGRYLVRGGPTEVLEDGWQPHRLVVLEFEDLAAARRWYDSPEYTEARKVRQVSSIASVLLVEGS